MIATKNIGEREGAREAERNEERRDEGAENRLSYATSAQSLEREESKGEHAADWMRYTSQCRRRLGEEGHTEDPGGPGANPESREQPSQRRARSRPSRPLERLG